uniref:Putative harbinger transposase-derived protein n=1 Tax=Helianthus annuus TaxID=4232 RepID=A0A251VHS3_HELAN
MAEKTTRDTLEHFCYGICQLYGKRYLRNPTWNDLQKIYEVHLEKHGIPSMIGSLDCRQWRWYNCPTAWRGQHTRGDQKGPTLVLQGVASYDLWVWSAFFGVAGCFNDINTLEASPLIEGYISGTIPKAGFHANGNDYEHGYYLGDGIYPDILKNYKSLRERTSRGVLGFYSNDGILSGILVACGIRIKYEWPCMLASFCII